MAKLGAGPEAVAKVVERAITSSRPRVRYRVTPSARIMIGLNKSVTARTWDRMMKGQFPQPGRN
jgi:hypothetical protein